MKAPALITYPARPMQGRADRVGSAQALAEVCRAETERVASAYPHADRHDVESARRAPHHGGLFPAGARDAGEAGASRPCVGRLRCHSRIRHADLHRAPSDARICPPVDPVFDGDTTRAVPCAAVVLAPARRADTPADALAFYQRLRAANRALACHFVEGLVMKRAHSAPPEASSRACKGEFAGNCAKSQHRRPPAS